MSPPLRTLRLALAMRGGVSLSVWIGGAVHEIDHTRRLVTAEPDDGSTPNTPHVASSDDALREVIRRLGRVDGIEIDVIAGTSAGGLNGVLLASSLRTGRPLDPLRLVWLDTADLQRIQRPVHTPDRLSLLDGAAFYNTLRDVLHDEFFAEAKPPPEGQRIDLLLPVTVLDGIAVTAADDPTTPVTERRHDAVVHVRHHGADPTWSDLVAGDGRTVGRIVANLAAGARSTASFPGAFEPFVVPQPNAPTTDLRGTLLTPVQRPETIQLVDGGVLDNIPVGKAVRAIAAAAADRPTERWLLYLQPNPSVAEPVSGATAAGATAGPPPDRRLPAAMTKVLSGLAGALVNESLIDDLELLRAHNEDVLARRAERAVLLGRPITSAPTEDRARFEAACLLRTLDRPHEEIAWWPIGLDLPASQLAGWSTDARARLAGEMAAAVSADAGLEGLRPFEPVLRTGALLVEWARELEQGGAADPTVAGWCKSLAYLVAAWAEQAAGLADIAWLASLPAPPAPFRGADAMTARRAAVASVQASRDLPGPATAGTDLGLVTASTEAGAPAVGSRSSLSDQLWSALAGIASALAGSLRGDGVRAGTGLAATLVHLLPQPGGDVAARLAAIDAQLAPLHRGRALRDIAPIRYRTISGAAPTIFATGSSPAEEAPFVGPGPNHRFASLERAGTGLLAPVRPATKLAGNQISSFSAFLFRHWRANDWMWGRADAVRTLIETILDPVALQAAVVADGPDEVMAIVQAYIAAPFGDGAAAGASDVASHLWTDNEAALRQQVEALATEPAKTDTAPAAVSAAAGSGAPNIVRELVIARRQLEIFAVELARTGSDALIVEERGWQRRATRQPADALDDRMDQWDRSVRRLGDVRGRRQLTETGLRATLVGWKALLVGQSAAVRGVVAPLLSPLPLVVLGVFLNRRRAVAALALLATFVVTPRLERAPIARGLVAAAIVVGVVGLLWLLRHRSPTGGRPVDGMIRGHGAPWAAVALVTAVYAVVVAIWPTVWSGARAPLATSPLLSPAYLAPAIAAAVAAGLLWCWAWWLPRMTMAVFTAGMTFLWVWLSAPELCTSASGVRTTCGLTGAPSFFGSLWWGVVIVLYVSTWVAGLHDFGRERHRTLRAPSSTQ